MKNQLRFGLDLLCFAWKQVLRHRTRSLLTVVGVASGMFLLTSVETMQRSLRVMTEGEAADTTLVVYRENRFCPATSRLPEHYAADIRRIPGVREVVPVQIVVNNCGASLDVITFRGVPPEDLVRFNPELRVIEGSIDAWKQRSDGALIGENFAVRRGLRTGDRFDAVGVTTTVMGIIRSEMPQDNNVAYVHLPFLQQASRGGLGIVTQFSVKVHHADDLKRVADAIDATFHTDSTPTNTRPERAFFAQTASELIQLIGFTRWLGFGAAVAVVALVANALVLIARSRVKETAVLQTIGFQRGSAAWLMVFEGMILGIGGSVLGITASMLFFELNRFTFGNEGLTLALRPDAQVALTAMLLSLMLAILASIWPALMAANKPIIASLRS
jgi:putative ABC transport system permease protein